MKDKVVKSKKLIIIVREYNSSMTGVLNVFFNGLGWQSELKNKSIAYIKLLILSFVI